MLRDFMKEHNNLVFCPIDKSKDLVVYTTDQYSDKLNDVFEPTKFINLKYNPLKSDIAKCNKRKAKDSKCLSISDSRLIPPIEG